MFYDNELEKLHSPIDCLTCKHFDKVEKKCKGFGKKCFEFDPITQTILDPYTKLPLKKVK